jgi:hypothetical protein
MDGEQFDRGEETRPGPLLCSSCKSPMVIEGNPGARRAALIEDGVSLCDVCAPSGNLLRTRDPR